MPSGPRLACSGCDDVSPINMLDSMNMMTIISSLLLAVTASAAGPATIDIIERGSDGSDDHRIALMLTQTNPNGWAEDSLAIGCDHVGEDELFIRVIPEQYHAAPNDSVEPNFWEPSVIYKFDDRDSRRVTWVFTDRYVELGAILRRNEAKARFLHELATSKRVGFSLDIYELLDAETVSFDYSFDRADLERVIRTCNPERVIRYLEEWSSPAIMQSPISD